MNFDYNSSSRIIIFFKKFFCLVLNFFERWKNLKILKPGIIPKMHWMKRLDEDLRKRLYPSKPWLKSWWNFKPFIFIYPIKYSVNENSVQSSTGIIEKYIWKLTLPKESVPDWINDNKYLLKGHRPQLRSMRKCLKSVFRLHTETLNIWTHLLGMHVAIRF
jgi:hypothetical protein